MVTNLMMSAKMATLGLLKIKITWNKGYEVILSVHDVTSKILSRHSNYVVDVVMWPKFGNEHFYERRYHNLRFIRIWPDKPVFLRGGLKGWFKFNNLGLTQGIALTFYTSVAKGLKLKVRKFRRLIRTFAEVTGKNILNRVKGASKRIFL